MFDLFIFWLKSCNPFPRNDFSCAFLMIDSHYKWFCLFNLLWPDRTYRKKLPNIHPYIHTYIQTTVKVVIITAPKCKLEFRMITLDNNISTHLSSVSIIHLSSIFLTGKKGLSSLFFFLLKCQGHSQPNKPVAWDLQMFGLITLPLVVN